MTKKIKLTEAAKDLKIDNQELIDLMEKYDGTKRKNTTALSADEMNYIKKISDILELTFGVDKSLITEENRRKRCLFFGEKR